MPMVPVHQGQRERIETGDRQINRTRKWGCGRQYQHIPECHILDDSEFSRPNVCRYDYMACKIKKKKFPPWPGQAGPGICHL